jgi:hypothetical protein
MLEPMVRGVGWISSFVGALWLLIVARSVRVRLVVSSECVRIVNIGKSVTLRWEEIELIEAGKIRLSASDDLCLRFVRRDGKRVASLATLWPGRSGAATTIEALQKYGNSRVALQFRAPDRGALRAGNGWRRLE